MSEKEQEQSQVDLDDVIVEENGESRVKEAMDILNKAQQKKSQDVMRQINEILQKEGYALTVQQVITAVPRQ